MVWPPVLVLLALLASDWWVYTDASAHFKRGTPVVYSTDFRRLSRPSDWFVACLAGWPLFFPIYLSLRR